MCFLLVPYSEFYQCPESVQVCLHHVSFLFHCLTYSNNNQAILDFHSSILSQVEAGLLTWSRVHDQTFTLQRLNFRASLKDLPTSGGSVVSDEVKRKKDEQQKKKIEAEKATCKEFRDGNCTHQANHGGKRHVCHYCWYMRDNHAAVHTPAECPWGKKR